MSNLTSFKVHIMSQQPYNPDEYTPLGARFNGGADHYGEAVPPYEPTSYGSQERLLEYGFSVEGYRVLSPFSTGWVERPYKTVGWLFLPLHSCKEHTRGTHLEFIVAESGSLFVGVSQALQPTTDNQYHWHYGMYKIDTVMYNKLFQTLNSLTFNNYWGYMLR